MLRLQVSRPECMLLSFKVLDKNGEGDTSTIIAAIQMIQQLNGYGRQLIVHGVNLSLGYDFDPEWFACGQSPICVEVDRLARSGVAVVIAAGNTGKGFALTINDPGNAELAITVGSTHRDMPHRYGVSYFSSKGPTGDGRLKPDLLAPGERIISCAAGPDLETYLKRQIRCRGRQESRVLSGAQWNEHGRTSRFRYDCGHSFDPRRIHWPSGTGQKLSDQKRHRSWPRAEFPGRRAGRYDANDSVNVGHQGAFVMQFDFAYPYFQVQMTQDGSVFDQNEVNTLMAGVTSQTGGPSDLIVMSHGWNNNMDDAKEPLRRVVQIL